MQKEVETPDNWLGEVFDLYDLPETGVEHISLNKMPCELML